MKRVFLGSRLCHVTDEAEYRCTVVEIAKEDDTPERGGAPAEVGDLLITLRVDEVIPCQPDPAAEQNAEPTDAGADTSEDTTTDGSAPAT